MWIIIILFFILTVVLLSGKGGFLVAGYNTASKEERAQYNEKRLCRVMGLFMGIITIIVSIPAFLGEKTPEAFFPLMPVIIIAGTIVVIILANTICKEKNPRPINEIKDINTKKIVKYTAGFIIIVTISIGVLLVSGDVQVQLNDKNIEIKASYWSDKSIYYKDVKSVDIIENIEIGRRTNGFQSIKLKEGRFTNNTLGYYTLYVYNKCKTYIVIETDSDTFVINAENESDTEKLYAEIISIL